MAPLEDYLTEDVQGTAEAKPKRSMSEEARANMRAGQQARRANGPKKIGRTPTGELKTKLAQLISTIGGLVCMANVYDGTVIIQGAPALSEAYCDLAKDNPKLAKALEGLTRGGAYGAVIAATLAVAIPIAANHKLIPDSVASVFAPDMAATV